MKKKTFIVQLLDSKKPNIKSFTQIEDANFYSNDTDASLVFIPHEDSFDFQSAKVVMFNRGDESLVERDMQVTTEEGRKVASYELPEEIISHWGQWIAQPVFISGGEIYSGAIVPFSVERHLMHERPPKLTEVVTVTKFIQQSQELVNAMIQAEAQRITEEQVRQDSETDRVQAENERSEWFETTKPEVEQSITKSTEALTKSQNALNVANGIDAKATNALSLSESADTLSKSVQEQFNQVIIDGDSSVEAAQARVDASGQTNATLKARLDKEHNEVTTQLAQKVGGGKLAGMADLEQDVKEAMTGGSVAVVGKGAVTNETLANDVNDRFDRVAEETNLIKKYKMIDGERITSTGTTMPSEAHSRSKLIPVSEGERFANVSGSQGLPPTFVFYKGDTITTSNFVSQIARNEVIVPAGTTHMLFWHSLSVKDTLIIKKMTSGFPLLGEETFVYKDVYTKSEAVSKVELENWSKQQKFEVANLAEYIPNKNLLILDGAELGSFNSQGIPSESTVYKRTDYISVKPNTSYAITIDKSYWKVWYDSDKNVISSTPYVNGLTNNIELSPPNAYFVRFAIEVSDFDKEIMFEENTVKTEYEPYGYRLKNLIPNVESEVSTARGGEITYRLTQRISEMASDFYKHWKLKDKDLTVVLLGDSLSTMNNYTTPRTDASVRPPLMTENAYPTMLEELLRWEGQEYKRYDVPGVFTEVASTVSNPVYDEAWDRVITPLAANNKPAITRILEGTNCSVSYLIPSNANRCDFIYRTDHLNAPNAVVSINKGDGFVQVFDYDTKTWVEANGYSYSAKETGDIINVGDSSYKESVYQRRLKMKTTRTKNDGTIRVTIANNGEGRLTYWGIQYSPLNFFIDFLAQARGGHNIARLRVYERIDVDVFEPDLILVQNCTNNEGIFVADSNNIPKNVGGNTPHAQATRFLTYTNELEAKVYNPTVLNFTLYHAWTTYWMSTTDNKVNYCYSGENKFTGFDYHDYLDIYLKENGKKQLLVWKNLHEESKVKAELEGLPIMESTTKASGRTGATWTVDGTHYNDEGARVIFEILKPFFTN